MTVVFKLWIKYQIGNVNSGRATIILEMAEISTVLLTETQNYPFEAFLSDTGGAAGLFLGLHILGKNIISYNL